MSACAFSPFFLVWLTVDIYLTDLFNDGVSDSYISSVFKLIAINFQFINAYRTKSHWRMSKSTQPCTPLITTALLLCLAILVLLHCSSIYSLSNMFETMSEIYLQKIKAKIQIFLLKCVRELKRGKLRTNGITIYKFCLET